jgi:O-antigen/teichoic acid export membrane protein
MDDLRSMPLPIDDTPILLPFPVREGVGEDVAATIACPAPACGPAAEGPRWSFRSLFDDQALRGFWALVDQGIVSGASFVTSVLIGHACSRGELGVYYLAMSIVLFVRGIQERIICVPYMVHCPQREGRSLAALGGSTLVHQFVLSGLTSLGLAVFLVVLGFIAEPTLPPSVVAVMLVAVPLVLLREYVRQYTFAHLQFMTATLLDAAVTAIQLGGLAALGWMHQLTVPAIYAIMGAGCGLACLGWYLLRREPFVFDRQSMMADWHQNWTFGKWVLLSQLVSTIAPSLLPWLLAGVWGMGSTGELAACSTLAGFANVLLIGLANALTPEAAGAFTRGGSEALWKVLRRAATVFTLIIGTLTALFFVAGNWLVTLVYGDGFAGSGPLLGLLGLSLLAGSIEVVAGNGLWAVDRPRANLRADVANFVTAAAAGAWLVLAMGAMGVALGLCLGALVGAIVRFHTLVMVLRSIALTETDAVALPHPAVFAPDHFADKGSWDE